LFFRDHLRSHPEAAARYESLKRKLADRHEGDRDAYSDGKAPFLRSIERSTTRRAVSTAAAALVPDSPPRANL
jgi:GrpB-like predicted nucleotidyltransferase (UPF0157 family)